MKVKKCFAGFLSFIMIVTAIVTPLGENLSDLFDKLLVSSNAEAGAGSPLDSFDYIPVSYQYESDHRKYSFEYTYNDGMFMQDANKESPDLAKVSVSLAMSAYELVSVRDCLSEMGFLCRCYNYEKIATYDDNDFVAYTVANKKISYNNENYSVYIVPIRGTSGNCEWFSNFNLGSGTNHQGFYKAANEVINSVFNQIKAESDTYDKNHTILLTTGHSRGAAVANIVAGRMSCNGLYSGYISRSNIFGYNFACPAVSKGANTNIKNIRNYNNPGDVIASVPLEDWGFHRFGIDCTLDTSDDIYDNFKQRFKALTGTDYDGMLETDSWVFTLKMLADSQESFNSNKNQFIFGLLAAFLIDDDSFVELAARLAVDYNVNPVFVKNVLVVQLKKMITSAGKADLALLFSDSYQELNSLLIRADDALGETAGMNSDEFNSWLRSNSSFAGAVENKTDIKIQTRSDISKARSQLSNEMGLVSYWASDIETLFNLFYQANGVGKLGNTLFHAHTGETYILWINSMYYGYMGWYNNKSIRKMDIPKMTTNIGSMCFYGCTALTELTIPKTITKLDSHAFYGCTGLKKVTMPADLDYVISTSQYSHYASFYNCKNVEEIRFTVGQTNSMTDFNSNNYTLEGIAKEKLTTVSFDEGITHIGKNGFNGCSALTTVNLPSTVTSIGDNAFASCSGLKGIKFPDEIENLGAGSFCNCTSLESINFTKNIKEIPYKCFYGCTSLTELTIPKTITKLDSHAFYGCTGLKKVTMPADLDYVISTSQYSHYASFYNCKNVEEIRFTVGQTNSMTDFNSNNYTLEGIAKEKLTTVSFDEGITHIGKNGFNGCSALTTVNLPSTVTSIGDNAFASCSGLKGIKFPDEIENLGAGSFCNCTSLESINFTKNIKEIPYKCFYGCTALTELTIPKTITKLDSHAFYGCTGLKKVTMPADLDYVISTSQYSHYASFYNCNNVEEIRFTVGQTNSMTDFSSNNYTLERIAKEKLTTVSFDEGITHIGKNGFDGCSVLITVNLPSTVTSIGDYAFASCLSLKGIKFPDEIENLGAGSFYNCTSLESISFTKNIKEIPFKCFSGCTALTELTIPKTITKLNNYAFGGCTGLKKVTMPADIEYNYRDNYTFNGCNNVEEIRFTVGRTNSMTDFSSNNYTLERIAKEKLTTVSFDEGITHIGNNGFDGCSVLTTVNLPSTVTSIGDYAFASCLSLKGIKFPDEIENLGAGSFYNCTSLESISFTKNIKEIPFKCFSGCTALTELTIPKTITKLNNYAFGGCTGLKKVTMPADIEYNYRDNYTFNGCNNVEEIRFTVGRTNSMTDFNSNNYTLERIANRKLTTVSFDEGITHIGNNGFDGCSVLTTVNLPSTVTSIGDYAFASCSGLKGIKFPDEIENLGAGSFCNCTSLESINFTKNIKEIPFKCFSGCTALTELTIPKTITKLNNYAFGGCTGLKKVTMPADIEYNYRDNYTFNGCNNVEEIRFTVGQTNSMTDFSSNNYTLEGIAKEKLTTVSFDEGITHIGKNGFNGCSALTTVNLPSTVTSIGDYGFNGCKDLTDVYYSGTEDEWKMVNIGSFNQSIQEADIHWHEHSCDCEVTIPATCTDEGVMTYTCECGYQYKEAIPMTEHSYILTLVEPTFTEQGYTLEKCSVCGNEVKSNYTSAYTRLVSDAGADEVTSTEAILTWSEPENADGVIVYRFNPETRKWIRLTKLGQGVTSYTVTDLEAETEYKFALKTYKTINGREIKSDKISQISVVTMSDNI